MAAAVDVKTFRFEVLHRSTKSNARVGRIHTPHGTIDTPNFVAVGTNGSIKALDSVAVDQIGLQLLFCNTYHLMVQPGTKLVAEAGGLHNFIQRKLPIITDSGGFQVFSLAYGSVANELKSKGAKKCDGSVLKIEEEGVLFRSYRDGSKILLTPESSVQAQKELGADMIIPLDELPPYHADPHALVHSFERTHRWMRRSLEEHLRNPKGQAMFGVGHGGVHRELRQRSCKTLSDDLFEGFALGGSLGKTKEDLLQILEWSIPCLDPARPVHLLGIGDLESIERSLPYGIDTFDSSYPTKAARHGIFFTRSGKLNLFNSCHKEDLSPIDPSCRCYTCQHYSRAYISHLFKAKELTAFTLATLHNLTFMVDWMDNRRTQISNDLI